MIEDVRREERVMPEQPKIPPMEQIKIRITSPDCFGGERGSPLPIWGEEGVEVPDYPQDATFFLQAMMNRMGVSFHKYGSIYDMFPEHKTGLDNLNQRIEKYREDGNVEWLVDAANYIMIEFLAPSHELAHFRATTSDESPGSVLRDGEIDWGKHTREEG